MDDIHADELSDVTWTCEAFGIPDLVYKWMKDGNILVNIIFYFSKHFLYLKPTIYLKKDPDRLDNRFQIEENILTIKKVSLITSKISF